MAENKKPKYDEEFKKSIVQLYKDGVSKSSISKEHGVSQSTLNNWIKKYSDIESNDNELKEIEDETIESNSVFKRKKPFYQKWSFWVVVIIVAVNILNGLGSSNKDDNAVNIEWPNLILSRVLPEPPSNYGYLSINSEEYLSINILKTSEEQYRSYVNACCEKGFIADVKEYDTTFVAKNEAGYELMLCYFESDEEMSIDLTAPSNSDEILDVSTKEDYKEEISSNDAGNIVDESERTYEVVRRFIELYNEELDPDILNTKEFITEDRILRYDEAYAIQGDIEGEYILIMNFGLWDTKDEIRIEMYADTPKEVFEIIYNVSKVIEKPLTEEEMDNTKEYLNECFADEYQRYTEWTGVNSITYWSGYNAVGDNYEVLIEFSVDKFYK